MDVNDLIDLVIAYKEGRVTIQRKGERNGEMREWWLKIHSDGSCTGIASYQKGDRPDDDVYNVKVKLADGL